MKLRHALRSLAVLAAAACVAAGAAACGPDAKAPVPVGFTGTCQLTVQHEPGGYMSTFLTPDELKTHIVLHIVKDALVTLHVELPDTRNSSSLEKLPDNPLLEGDAKSDALLDREGDVDIPMTLHARGGTADPWELPARVRFRGDHAEVVAGRMIAKGRCVRPAPTE